MSGSRRLARVSIPRALCHDSASSQRIDAARRMDRELKERPPDAMCGGLLLVDGCPLYPAVPITPKSRLSSTPKSGSADSWPVTKRNPTIKLKTAAKTPKTR